MCPHSRGVRCLRDMPSTYTELKQKDTECESTCHSFENPAENYQPWFGLFIPLNKKERGVIVVNAQVRERCWRSTRDAHGAETEVEAMLLLLMRLNSGRGIDL